MTLPNAKPRGPFEDGITPGRAETLTEDLADLGNRCRLSSPLASTTRSRLAGRLEVDHVSQPLDRLSPLWSGEMKPIYNQPCQIPGVQNVV